MDKLSRIDLQSKSWNTGNTDKQDQIAVSVLVAVYNPQLQWLKELLMSVEAQSFRDFEVYVLQH